MEAAAAGCCLVGDGLCVYLYIPVFMCLSWDVSRDVCTGLLRAVYLLAVCLPWFRDLKAQVVEATQRLVNGGKDYQKEADAGEGGVRGWKRPGGVWVCVLFGMGREGAAYEAQVWW